MTPVQVSLTVSNCLRIERNFLRIMPCDLTLAFFPDWCCNALPPWHDLLLCSEHLPTALRGLALFLTPENLSLFSLPGIYLPTLLLLLFPFSLWVLLTRHFLREALPESYRLVKCSWAERPRYLTSNSSWCLSHSTSGVCLLVCAVSHVVRAVSQDPWLPCSLLYPRTHHMEGPE